MNTSEAVYSQGYSLVDWFNSAAGGGQHVLTNRHPSTEFTLKGLDPLVSEVITLSTESTIWRVSQVCFRRSCWTWMAMKELALGCGTIL